MMTTFLNTHYVLHFQSTLPLTPNDDNIPKHHYVLHFQSTLPLTPNDDNIPKHHYVLHFQSTLPLTPNDDNIPKHHYVLHFQSTLPLTPNDDNIPKHHYVLHFQSTLPLTPNDENFWRLVKILLEDVPSKLRTFFQSAFQKKYRIAWGENSTSGELFMAMVPPSKKRDPHITCTVEQGITANFDCTSLFYCLLYSGTGLLLPGARKKGSRQPPFAQSERVDQLREQRNALCHATTPSVSQADFHARITEIEDIYRELQWDQTQLKKAARDPLWPTEYDILRQKIEADRVRIDDHEQRLQDLDQGQQNHEQRLQGLDHGQQGCKKRLRDLDHGQQGCKKRQKKLEQLQQDQEKFVKTVEGMWL